MEDRRTGRSQSKPEEARDQAFRRVARRLGLEVHKVRGKDEYVLSGMWWLQLETALEALEAEEEQFQMFMRAHEEEILAAEREAVALALAEEAVRQPDHMDLEALDLDSLLGL